MKTLKGLPNLLKIYLVILSCGDGPTSYSRSSFSPPRHKKEYDEESLSFTKCA